MNKGRNNFLIGKESLHMQADDISGLKNKRGGTGNYFIARQNYEIPQPRSRVDNLDFDRLRALDIQNNGIKIQLGDKTLSEMFHVQLDDPTDVTWIAEKNRMVAEYKRRGLSDQDILRELDANKPLGREQRKVSKMQNFNMSNMTVAQKIEELKQEVVEGRADNDATKAFIVANLGLTLQKVEDLAKLTQKEIQDVVNTMSTMHIPKDHIGIGLESRFIDINYYKQHQGLIHLLLLTNIGWVNKGITTYDKPVLSSDEKQPTPIQIATVQKELKSFDYFLDLDAMRVQNKRQMADIVNSTVGGIQNKMFAINPAYLAGLLNP